MKMNVSGTLDFPMTPMDLAKSHTFSCVSDVPTTADYHGGLGLHGFGPWSREDGRFPQWRVAIFDVDDFIIGKFQVSTEITWMDPESFPC